MRDGDLALVLTPQGREPVPARYNIWDEDDPESDYWSFFGSDYTYRRGDVKVVQRVRLEAQ